MPVYYNLDIIQGSTFSARLTAKNDAGAAINLDGHNVRGSIKNRYSDTTSLISFSPVIVDETNGIIDIELTSIQTATLPITQAVYDIEMFKTGVNGEDDNTHVVKLLDGKTNIHPEVTT